jgi:hypothetical protein
LRRRVGRVAFAHLDADLFSSTLFALRWLTPLLNTGSVLQFDEFIGGDCAESRAFEEWRVESGLQLIRIAEVDREPSGWGSNIDRRLVFQVVGDEPLSPPFEYELMPSTLRFLRRALGESAYNRLKEIKKRALG